MLYNIYHIELTKICNSAIVKKIKQKIESIEMQKVIIQLNECHKNMKTEYLIELFDLHKEVKISFKPCYSSTKINFQAQIARRLII